MKVLIVFGTRPEAIKMAPLVKAMQRESFFDLKVCVTAQHRQMLDQVLDLFEIVPDYDLDIMKENQDLYDLSSRVLLGMRNVLQIFRPDWVFVHGDTTTSTMTALASFYEKIKVAHVEAGLRTHNIYSPYPEEMNRLITSKLASLHLAPTEGAKFNLLKEGILESAVKVTGNTVIDALMYVDTYILENFEGIPDVYSIGQPQYILVTGHRRENFGEGFINICEALRQIAIRNPKVDIIYPVHLNPNVKNIVHDVLAGVSNIYLVKPLDYLPFLYLMKHCYIVLTDSGGIQEEAPSFGKPVLVMRDTTERPEAVDAGTVKLVGTSVKKIVSEVEELLEFEDEYRKMSYAHNPYGDGTASEMIVTLFKKGYL